MTHTLRKLLTLVVAVLASIALATAQQPASPARPRVVITADPEQDDLNTLIRAFL